MGNWDSELACAIHIHGPAAAGPIPSVAWRLGGRLARKKATKKKKRSPPKKANTDQAGKQHTPIRTPPQPSVRANRPDGIFKGAPLFRFCSREGKNKPRRGEEKTASSATGASVSGPHGSSGNRTMLARERKRDARGWHMLSTTKLMGVSCRIVPPRCLGPLSSRHARGGMFKPSTRYPYHHPTPMPS